MYCGMHTHNCDGNDCVQMISELGPSESSSKRNENIEFLVVANHDEENEAASPIEN